MATVMVGLLALGGCLSEGLPIEPPESADAGVDASEGYVVVLSDCRRAHHTLTTTRETYRPEHPDTVRPYDAVREIVWFDFLECRQAADPAAVMMNFQLALFADRIQPPNASAEARSWYVFEARTNGPSFAENATRLGLPVRLIEEAALTVAPFTSGGSLGTYELRVPASQSPDYRVEGSIDLAPSRDFRHAEAYYFDSDAGLRVLRATLEGKEGDNGQGTVRFGPESYWGARSSVDAWDHVSRYQTNVAGELRWDVDEPALRSSP